MYTIAIVLSLVILAQAIYIQALQRSPMGVLTPTALRIRLKIYSMLRIRVFVIGCDMRKLKSVNEQGNHGTTNALIYRLFSVLRKNTDIVGQFAGDEFVIVGRWSKDGVEKVIDRLLKRRDEINASLPADFRNGLSERTGCLVDGIHLAIASIQDTRDAYSAATKTIDATEPLKAGGRQTGNRDTSGRPGTLIVEL